MMLRDVVVGVGKGISISVPIARVREIQGIQGLVRIARSSCRRISLANLAVRSILVRRTRIERGVDYLGALIFHVKPWFTRPRRSDDARRGTRARGGGTSNRWSWSQDRAACGDVRAAPPAPRRCAR